VAWVWVGFASEGTANAQSTEHDGMILVRAGDTYDSWFYLDKYETTNAEMHAHSAEYEPGNEFFKGNDKPATAVSFVTAQEYCQAKGKRMPTTSELSLACGGPEGLVYSYGNGYDPLKARVGRHVWSDGPKPVGSYEPNGYGIYDVVGNVWEWTDDGSGQQPRVHGGSWLKGPRHTKCGVSQPADPIQRVLDFGIRCARTLGRADIDRLEAQVQAMLKAAEAAASREEAIRRRKREAAEALRRGEIDAEAQQALDVEEAERLRIEDAEAARVAAFQKKVSNMAQIGEGLAMYYLDKTEVSVEAFQEFKPDFVPHELSSSPRQPATGVSYQEGSDYCRSLGKRLPTDGEWLSACLGKSGHLYGYGTAFDRAKLWAGRPWFEGTQDVGTTAETSYGNTEMAGNVWEWTNGWYDKDKTRRTILGGAWSDGSDRARCTAKDWHFPTTRVANLGFRCVAEQMEP
jgi:formylglycine-generating enzyme required for sulfatase activity